MRTPSQGTYPPPGGPEEITPSRAHALRESLDRLSHEQRLLLSLRYVEGLGIEELAAAFAVPPAKVTASLGAAMQSLAKDLPPAEGLRSSQDLAPPRGSTVAQGMMPVEGDPLPVEGNPLTDPSKGDLR